MSSSPLERRLKLLESRVTQSPFYDPIAMPDFTLWSAGGRIIPTFTSPTYRTSQSVSWFKGFFISHSLQPEWRFPEVAISPGVDAGNCWPMNGSSGAIGISLAREISPQSITIEHVPKHLSLDSRSAPKNLEVWAVLDEVGDETQGTDGLPDFLTQFGHSPADTKERFVFLSDIDYNVLSVDHIQNFPLQHKLSRVAVIVVFVKSNWGNENFTCLYRIRVHGAQYPVVG
jgi:SUN domain-containing protein 1/2